MSIADFAVEEVVYSPDMAKPDLEEINRRLQAIQNRVDNLGERWNNEILPNRIVPTEHRVNQIIGIAKWAVPMLIGLLITFGIALGKLIFQTDEIKGQLASLQSNQVFRQDSQAVTTDPGMIQNAAVKSRENKIRVPPSDIQRVAAPLLRNVNAQNWSALLELLNLRSYVNSTGSGSV